MSYRSSAHAKSPSQCAGEEEVLAFNTDRESVIKRRDSEIPIIRAQPRLSNHLPAWLATHTERVKSQQPSGEREQRKVSHHGSSRKLSLRVAPPKSAFNHNSSKPVAYNIPFFMHRIGIVHCFSSTASNVSHFIRNIFNAAFSENSRWMRESCVRTAFVITHKETISQIEELSPRQPVVGDHTHHSFPLSKL